ncbi:anti-sigma-I factor RsgI family protein [Thermicanus aegyptius]|uniref:anti-sigma-I factor RsgI family protein n=1 Tax=Thermicanus aegyptius TaxID=94009 RepID=UPI0004113F49|nr:anti-sigma factor domain-containing protein [Thermicanus aegyptius]
MMHGTVMKITEQCIVVLCEDGKFRNLPHPPVMPKLGEIIPVPDAEITIKRNRWQRFKKYGMIAAAFLFLIGITILVKLMEISSQPVALVAIDINPGFELFVDGKGKVEKAVPVNDDAKWIMSEEQLIGKEFYTAVRFIVKKAEERGFLDTQTDKRWIWISVVDFGKAAFDVDTKKIIAGDQDYKIKMFDANEHQMEQAKKARLTLNKYIVYEQAKRKGIELSVEELRTHSIVSSLIRAGIPPEQFFEKNSDEKSSIINQKAEQISDNNSIREEKPSDDTQKVVQPIQSDTTYPLPKEQSKKQTGETTPAADRPEIKQRKTKDENQDHPASERTERPEPKPDAQNAENPSSEQKKAAIELNNPIYGQEKTSQEEKSDKEKEKEKDNQEKDNQEKDSKEKDSKEKDSKEKDSKEKDSKEKDNMEKDNEGEKESSGNEGD